MTLSWRQVNLLFLVCASQQFLSEGHIGAFTPLLLHDLGMDPGEVAVWTGLLYGIMMSLAFPLAPFWGVLAERFSRRAIILRSYYLMTVALLVHAWAPDVGFLILARLLMGLSFATIGVILGVQSLITPPNQIGKAIATVQACHPIAASLGPPLGALLIPHIGLRGLFVLDAGMNLVAALALTFLLPEPVAPVRKGSVLGRTREILGFVWTIRPLRWNFASAGLLRGATSVVDSYLPVRITQVAGDPALATTAIGWILGSYGVLTTIVTWFTGRIIDRTKPSTVYWPVMLFGTAIVAGLTVAPWLWLLGVLAALRSVPVAFGNTVLLAHQARVLPRELHTPIFGLAPAPRNLGGLVFPLLAAGAAVVAPGASLALGAASYFATALTGIQMARETQAAERASPRYRAPPSARD